MEPKNSNKQPYSTPQLTVYGDVREITQAMNEGGRLDSTSGPFKTA